MIARHGVDWATAALAATLLASLAPGCDSDDGSALSCEERPAAADAVACAEAAFWSAFHAPDAPAREAAHATLTAVIDHHADAPETARAHFLRGGMAMALSLENQLGGAYIQSIVPDFERAIELDPTDANLPWWLASMQMVLTYLGGDDAAFEQHRLAVLSSPELDSADALTISGTLSGFPLDTGLPHRAVELLEAFACDSEWCRRNTAWAPFSQPGLQVHFADAYARIGDRDQAEQHLLAALAAEDAAAWPYRGRAETMLAELDRIVDEYVALGDAGPAIDLVYANSDVGCLICHGER